jgi:hypothetical protein
MVNVRPTGDDRTVSDGVCIAVAEGFTSAASSCKIAPDDGAGCREWRCSGSAAAYRARRFASGESARSERAITYESIGARAQG